MKERLLDN